MAHPCPQADETAPLASWLDDLFGARQGFVYAPVGVGGECTKFGAYDFSGGFQPNYFSWPAERDSLVRHILERSRVDDVYLAPRLRTSRSAKTGTAHDGYWLYVDLDKPRTREQEQLLGRLLRRSHYLVQSGTQGHLHLYLRLRSELPVAALTALNQRLAQGLNGDSKWQDNAVLRPPGTLNHKAAARGGAPTTARVHSASSSKAWTVTALDRLLPSISAAQVAPVETEAPSWDGTVPRNFDELMDEDAVAGGRSERTFAFVMSLIENGAIYDELVEMAHGHPPTAARGDVERHVRVESLDVVCEAAVTT